MEKWEEARAALLSDVTNIDSEEKMAALGKTLNLGILMDTLIGSLNETKARLVGMGIDASNEDFMAGTDIQVDGQFVMVRVNLTTKEDADQREAMATDSGIKLSDLPKAENTIN